MARKSRKHITDEVTKNLNTVKNYKAAGYIRLSVVKENLPPDSIENQKKNIEDFLNTLSDISLRCFYIDENVSGTTFERPAFQAMLSDIDKGYIDCIVVKDLSRLGRDFLGTEYYIQQYFPARQVRFISVNDRLDTIDGVNNISFEQLSGIDVPVKNLLNQKIVDDIKTKTQSVIDMNIHDGKSIAPRAPYGYIKSSYDCHTLIPDPTAEFVVKEIFHLASKGTGLNEIVRRLNTSKTPTPINYARANGLQGDYQQGNGLWNTRTVRYILTNHTYIGDLIQGKDQYIVENTHTPLVDRVVFDAVQEMFSLPVSDHHNKTNIPREDNYLKGKVFCGSCGGKMQRRRGSGNADWYFFICLSNNRLGAGYCTGMYIRESDIMDAILFEIGRYADKNKNLPLFYENKRTELEFKVAGLISLIKKSQDNKRHRYEDFVTGIITVDDFKKERSKEEILHEKLKEIETQIELLNKSKERYQLFCDAGQNRPALIHLVSLYLKDVFVYSNRRMEVRFK